MGLYPFRRTSRGLYTETGFTLLELLVVVFIIALISGFAVLSVGGADNDRKMEQEVQQAGRLFSLAAQEAIVQGRPVGVFFSDRSYRFFIAGREGWEEMDDSGSFRPRTLAPEWRLELIREGKEMPLPTGNDQQPKADPQVLFYPSGEVIPFRLTWRGENGDGGYGLEVSATGNVGIPSIEEPL